MKPTPEILSLMAVAAELRAAGNSWEAISTQVHRRPRTCRSWVERHPQQWQELFDRAEERLLADLGGEAYFTLRKLVRTGSERVQHDTAKYLYSRRRDVKLRKQEDEPANKYGDWAP